MTAKIHRTETRRAARLLVRDREGRVLLLRHEDKRGRAFWATPGGGIEREETAVDAARREAREELGLDGVQLVERWTDRIEFQFDNRWVEQTETFFLVSDSAAEPDLEVTGARWREGIRAYRWWTLEELGTTAEVVYPPDMAARLEADFEP